jgi:hypothetical protein
MDQVKMEQGTWIEGRQSNRVQWWSNQKIDWGRRNAVGKKDRSRNSSLVNLRLYLWRGSRKVKDV